MIDVTGIVHWSATERSVYTELAVRELHVATRSLWRAVDFYARVFGFRLIRGFANAPLAMRITARADLILHPVDDLAPTAVPLQTAWGFVVADLDRARQHVWDLGLRLVRDSGAPDQIFRWRNGRSLYVQAPDDREIELVEIWNGARTASIARYRRGAHAPTPFDAALLRTS